MLRNKNLIILVGIIFDDIMMFVLPMLRDDNDETDNDGDGNSL